MDRLWWGSINGPKILWIARKSSKKAKRVRVYCFIYGEINWNVNRVGGISYSFSNFETFFALCRPAISYSIWADDGRTIMFIAGPAYSKSFGRSMEFNYTFEEAAVKVLSVFVLDYPDVSWKPSMVFGFDPLTMCGRPFGTKPIHHIESCSL